MLQRCASFGLTAALLAATAEPPTGTYDPPADYQPRPFDLGSALQQP